SCSPTLKQIVWLFRATSGIFVQRCLFRAKPLEGDGFEPSVPREGPTRRDGFIRLSSGGSEAHHRRSAISTARSGRRSPPGPYPPRRQRPPRLGTEAGSKRRLS